MNKIKIFKNPEFGQVRTMLIDNEPWFVGMDIAQALGYKRPSDAIASHVYEEDKLKRCFTVSGQGRNLVVINESGMYALIFGSKLEDAMRFKYWVTSEVLPSIRKYGGYFDGQEEMNDQELLARGYLVALRQIEARTKELEGLIPKGEFFDRFISLGDCICLRDTAKELGVPQNRFINILIDGGYLYRNQRGKLRFYSTSATYFKLKDYINKYNGQPGVYTVVRPEGRAYFYSLFKEMGEI
ncbi:BRO family protein [Clostridium sp. Cult2]|uniref:BRO family protein n=1 Tax=Clostridium sp. Cult2 TaxID=2079003 RepID=UPI001F00F2BC|nr:phage antirepressor KilAC domain-containing protein [Clostridium sp. Cult2]